MNNILVVGAGAQGAPCAAILARQQGVDRVLLGSSKLAAAAAVRDRIGSPKVTAAQVDGRDCAALVKAAREHLGAVDSVIVMRPSFCAMPVMRAALELGDN